MMYAIKIIALVCFLSASASSLLALDKGSLIFYPEAGLGLSSGFATALNPESASRFFGSPNVLFKEPQAKAGLSWNIGCGIDYALSGLLAATSGLFIGRTTHTIVYKKTGSAKNDLEVNTDFLYLTIPAGARLYTDLLMLGGGLYIGIPLSCDSSYKFGTTTEANIDALTTIGLFIDAGMNFTDINNLMVFFRFKSDLSYAFKDEHYIVTKARTLSLNLTVAYRFKTYKI
ncbi:MAG: hypothetical protein FWG13_04410 [Leptospirales bacterium]|nr:hypothetical protein [Leptospirales bacterium]